MPYWSALLTVESTGFLPVDQSFGAGTGEQGTQDGGQLQFYLLWSMASSTPPPMHPPWDPDLRHRNKHTARYALNYSN
ncbi:hypothetical protein [Paeniglutamicibacter sp. NPDC091659]|uniref:hypothetical protein n=1 Tax=Paeniglutamicibacter sp. NPDC091659 TaxID=3364389 RepID=UPI00380D998F